MAGPHKRIGPCHVPFYDYAAVCAWDVETAISLIAIDIGYDPGWCDG